MATVNPLFAAQPDFNVDKHRALHNNTIYYTDYKGIVNVTAKTAYAGSGGTSAGAYSDYPGTITFNITKLYSASASNLIITGMVGCYMSVAGFQTVIGLSGIAGAPDDNIGTLGPGLIIGDFFFNAVNTHALVSCTQVITTATAGTSTAKVRWRVVGGGTVNTDSNDAVRLVVYEVMK
jgi:hypothetical protein